MKSLGLVIGLLLVLPAMAMASSSAETLDLTGHAVGYVVLGYAAVIVIHQWVNSALFNNTPVTL